MALAIWRATALHNPFPSTSKSAQDRVDNIDPIPPGHAHLQHEPAAAAAAASALALSSEHRITLTEANNSHVLRKIDLHILPLVLCVYLLQFTDKSTLSYASVFGLLSSAHLHGQEFSWLGSSVYVAQLVFQPIVAYTLVRFRLGRFVAVSAMGWGVCLACMAAAHDFAGLLVARTVLGMFEAGIGPACVAMGATWWRRREQPVRIAAWYSMNGAGTIVGSLVSYGFAHVGSESLAPYQIIFLFFGCITVVYSASVWVCLPDGPASARFLRAEDKMIALRRLKDNQQDVESQEWKWDQVRESLLDFKTYGWFAMMFAISTVSGGISTFNTLILKEFGYDSFHTILLNMPFGAFQIVAILLPAWLATKLRHKSLVVVLLTFPAIAGALLLVWTHRDSQHRGGLLFGYYMISFYVGITPLVYSWALANTAGDTKTKTTTGMLFVGQCSGNILGPQLYSTGDAPLYRKGLSANLALLVALISLVIAQVLYLIVLNKRHGRRRVAEGGNADVVDRSMLEIRDRYSPGEESQEDQAGPGAIGGLTDFQNRMFVYVY